MEHEKKETKQKQKKNRPRTDEQKHRHTESEYFGPILDFAFRILYFLTKEWFDMIIKRDE